MKKILFLALTLAICFSTTSCFKKIKEAKEDLEDTTTGFKNLKKAAKEIQKAQQDIENLADVEPLSNDEFKAWMPEKVKDLNRTGFKLGVAGYANVSSAQINFANEDKSKKLDIEILDGAGAMGAMAIMAYKTMMAIDMEEESENGYKKTVKKGNIKYLIERNNSSDRTEITFLSKERFGIKATGRGMDEAEVLNHIKIMNFNKLG